MSARDALNNTVQSENDYRVLRPKNLIDPNLNSSSVAFDALGMVIATAVAGKGSDIGDKLADPTTHLEYDLFQEISTGVHAMTGIPPKKTATATRQSPGTASGSVGNNAESLVFRGTHGSVAQVPEQLAAKLRGKTFANFDEFRAAFWKGVAADPALAKTFGKSNLARLEQGLAPIAPNAQQYGKLKSYILHHKIPIEKGGGVFDLSNIEIVSPRYHQMLHGGK